MRNPQMIMKQEFVRKWTSTLQTCCENSSKYMSAKEKQNAIKQTAAIALGAAKGGSTAWSRAILANQYELKNNDRLLGYEYPFKLKHHRVMSAYPISSIKRKLTRRYRIRSAKRSTLMNQKAQIPSSVAKSIIKKQTQVLKTLIPGGETMNESCLVGEALDYIVSLKSQVEVMKELVIAAEYVKKP